MLVPHLLRMMADLTDESQWSRDGNSDRGSSDTIAAETCLDRLCCTLGGKTMLPYLMENIKSMLSSADWKQRHAALIGISAVGEGCKIQMEPVLGKVVENIVPFLQDSHPRVRYACCHALGLLAKDFKPTFQEHFHMEVVPGLLILMDDTNNPRVQAHAGAALINFSEGCPKAIMVTYLEPFFDKMQPVFTDNLLENGPLFLLEQLVTTIASVADVAGGDFMPYYDCLMPFVICIMKHAYDNGNGLKLLWGRAIECITIIALAVGKDKFMADYHEVMQRFVQTQVDEPDMAQDDPRVSYVVLAWARISKIMGEDFEQVLPLAMGQIIKAASFKLDVTVVDDIESKVYENDDDWEIVHLSNEKGAFAMKTAGLEEKVDAWKVLVAMFTNLENVMTPYTIQVMRFTVINLGFQFNDDIACAAADLLPLLINCGQTRGPELVKIIWEFVCPKLLNAIDLASTLEVKSNYLDVLAQCIEKVGRGCLSLDQAKQLFHVLDGALVGHFANQLRREEERKADGYDECGEDSLKQSEAQDAEILRRVCDVAHALFVTHTKEVLPMFEQLLYHFVKLIAIDQPWSDRQWGICFFDDLVEYTGQHAFAYQQYFLQPLITYICDKQAEVRQAAAYGVGVMAMYGGEPFIPACREAIPLLVKVISSPDSRSIENLNSTENAISAVTKICKHQPTAVNVDELLPHWLGWLPVWEDTEEAIFIYGYLADLIEMRHPLILGKNEEKLPHILEAIAEALHRGAMGPDSDVIMNRLAGIITEIQVDCKTFHTCVAELPDHQRAALTRLLDTLCTQ